MLNKTETTKINNKLIELNISKRELAERLGFSKSYNNMINVINRKISNKNIEWHLRKFINEKGGK